MISTLIAMVVLLTGNEQGELLVSADQRDGMDITLLTNYLHHHGMDSLEVMTNGFIGLYSSPKARALLPEFAESFGVEFSNRGPDYRMKHPFFVAKFHQRDEREAGD